MENIVIAVASAECGSSPVMPYIRKRTDGVEYARRIKLNVMLAALRCGFDVIDIGAPIKDPQEVIMPANRYAADAAIVLSYATFGSCKSFNDLCGCVAHCSPGRFYTQSRTLCEDICAFILPHRNARVEHDGMLGGANCKTAVVDAGYLTCFDEARLAADPDHASFIAEHIVMGLCENFGMPYLLRDDVANYPLISGSCNGKRGAKIKLVQTALAVNGCANTVDGIFGNSTELELKTFCINNDVDERGVGESFWTHALLTDKRRVKASDKTAERRYIALKLRAKLYCASDAPSDVELTDALNAFLADAGKPRVTASGYIDADAINLISAVGGGRPRLF